MALRIELWQVVVIRLKKSVGDGTFPIRRFKPRVGEIKGEQLSFTFTPLLPCSNGRSCTITTDIGEYRDIGIIIDTQLKPAVN